VWNVAQCGGPFGGRSHFEAASGSAERRCGVLPGSHADVSAGTQRVFLGQRMRNADVLPDTAEWPNGPDGHFVVVLCAVNVTAQPAMEPPISTSAEALTSTIFQV
jgi:hypothetical protein